jgi:hypothetical protein
MGVSKKFKVHMQIGTCALLWARWNMGNNIIFSNAKAISFIHVIKLATYWFACGLTYNQWRSNTLWILGATG